MSSLGPETQALIRAGRAAQRPSAADRERIAHALRARLDGAAGLSNAAAASTAKASAVGWPIVSTLVIGLAAGGLLIANALPTSDGVAGTPAPASAPPAPAAALSPAVDHGVTPAATPPASEAPATVQVVEQAPVRSRRQASDRLAEEVEILSRAQTDLHAGRFGSALRTLEEHARKFARGTLAQERRAARIQALCGLGRVAEADAELARLSPGSVHEGSSREACKAKRK